MEILKRFETLAKKTIAAVRRAPGQEIRSGLRSLRRRLLARLPLPRRPLLEGGEWSARSSVAVQPSGETARRRSDKRQGLRGGRTRMCT